MGDPRDAFDRAERILESQLAEGFIDQDEFNDQLRDLGREYRDMAEEAAQDAYDAERERW